MNKPIDFQGHRGARGLMPENSIPAFLKALEMGVNTLEMDVVITGDGQVLVSHEPFMNAEFCLDPNGNEILEEDQMSYNLYHMTLDSIQQYDCGSKDHPRFPDQQKMGVTKPLLSEVLEAVEAISDTIRYNIEIKSEQDWDDQYHPKPEVFSELVYEQIDQKIGWDRVTVQSFDFRILRYFHEKHPEVQLAVLVENKDSIEKNLQTLDFVPSIYSCDYQLLQESDVQLLHDKGLRVIPWTVNTSEEMKKLLDWGVDGLITDYPYRSWLSN